MKSRNLKSNGLFSLLEGPHKHKQHPNQQKGLDLYVLVVNECTGEICHKKLYENKKGLHFKHTGCSPSYLTDFIIEVTYIPFQILTKE